MNYVDYAILAFIGVSTLIGMYYGFTVSLLSTASFLFSWLASLILYPKVSKFIIDLYPNILEKIIYYTEGASKISINESFMPVAALSQESISNLVNTSGLPYPFNNLLHSNLLKASFHELENLGQYIDHTIANTIINLLSFLVLFFAIYIVFSIAISIVRNIMALPVLRQLDSLAGACFGAIKGVLFLFIIFSIIPVLLALVPVDIFSRYFEESTLAPFFLKSNIFTSFLRGTI